MHHDCMLDLLAIRIRTDEETKQQTDRDGNKPLYPIIYFQNNNKTNRHLGHTLLNLEYSETSIYFTGKLDTYFKIESESDGRKFKNPKEIKLSNHLS